MPEIAQMYAIQRDRDGQYWAAGRGRFLQGYGVENELDFHWTNNLQLARMYRTMTPVTAVMNDLRASPDFSETDYNVRLIEIRDTEINVPH